MSLSALPVEGWRSRRMGEKTEQQEVEDEFTCAGVLSGALRVLKPTVERLFGVTLSIGAEDTHSPQDGQIWLRLRGSCRDVEAAKLFVKGVVNQEAQQEVQFPEVLHCVFSGAKGLFMDCLIKNTSAHIVVGSQGCVLITGLAEPVVKAYSFIIDLVEKYRSSQGRRTDGGVGTPGESLESRRTFKVLVESLEDRHTLDLLVLPVMVKEALLDMVKQSGLDRASLDRTGSWATHRTVDEARGEPEEHRQNGNSEISRIHNKPKSHSQHSGFTPKSINGTDDMTKFATLHESYSPFSHHVIPVTSHDTQPQHSDLPERSSPQEVESEIPPQETDRLSVGKSEEFEHLLKFFTAMGFTEDVVHKVLARTGPKEASQILDLVQQEQDKYVQQKGNCDSESRNEDSVAAMTGVTSGGINESDRRGENATEEDFVLGVVKKAAATCGYREERVEEVYSNLPELNPHELLLELQRERVRESDRRRDDEKQRRGAESTRENELEAENRNKRGDQKIGVNSATFVEKRDTKHARGKSEESPEQLNTAKWTNIPPDTPTSSQNTPPIHISPVPVRGPPQTKYPSKLSLETLIPDDIPSKTHPINPQSSRHPQSVPQNLPIFSNLQHQPKHSQGKASATAAVTGRQRFLESLNMPFRLQLSDDPGDPTLRYIIIDGSNVAMSHGLGLFFSCRGIALAVQHFWGRGHRKITVFVPQWRLKKHPNIKEQNYLTELQDLGLLSCTPSREVEGKRINSYDDRFMLNLAQTTNGVIVTNDNLRDLVDESTAWRDIVKRSLLQYLFAGDLFMIPDDPMGRGGPHLNDFLHAQSSSSSVPASHSFAGVSSSLPSPAPAPRAHTEVLQYRDRTPGGKSHTRGQGSLREEASDRSQPRERTLEETLNLKLSLKSIFPEQERVIIMILQSHPTLRDINRLSHFILEQQN